ncbi:MAG: metallophosphoesterase [Bacillota bacterium]|nr:metallophosphoesterase [Bacillota bacterium]
MKILVISDTHGSIDKTEEVIRENGKLDVIIHLGDYIRDAEDISYIFPEIPVEAVMGNCDRMAGDLPSEKLLEYMGKRIFITHGHNYSVKWEYGKLYMKAAEMCADMVLFGHTHTAELVKDNGLILLNPGSLSEPRNSVYGSYAIVNIDRNGIDARIVYLD